MQLNHVADKATEALTNNKNFKLLLDPPPKDSKTSDKTQPADRRNQEAFGGPHLTKQHDTP